MSLQRAAHSKPAPRRAKPLPSLPPHIWAHILSFLTTPTALCTVAQTCSTLHSEIVSSHFDAVWRKIWDLQSNLPSHALLATPWKRRRSGWRQQVCASYHLESVSSHHASRVVFMPPRYNADGSCVHHDRVAGFSAHFDVLDQFGRAVVVHAFAESVLIAFERAIALLRRTSRFHQVTRKASPASSLPSVYYDTSCHVQRIISFSSQPLKSTSSLLAITASSTLLCINVHQQKYRAITYSVLDTFLMQNGLPTTVTCSTDDKYALVGFDSGVVKVVEIQHPARKQTLCMRESVDILAANQKYVVASSSIQPITLCVWKLSNGACVHNITQQSEGWNRIHTIAAIQPLAHPNKFYVWNGLDRLFVLDVSTGSMVHNVDVHASFVREIRSAVEEAEHGAGSAQIGACKLALFADEKSLALATSNRVFVISPSSIHRGGKVQRQFDGVRGALVALSTDDRVVVTAEGNAFGRLGVHVSGRASLATLPRLQVWNVENEQLSSEIQLPSAATSLSVCADVVAVVCGAVGKAVVVFAGGL